MRAIIILWAIPLFLFWGWYGLSANDISFGSVYLSRALHDMVFQVYGDTIGVPPSDIPMMLAVACVVDTGIIGAIAAFRWRASWYPALRRHVEDRRRAWSASRAAGAGEGFTPPATAGRAHPAE